MPKSRTNTSVRLTPEAARLLKELAHALGVTQTAIIEMAIRSFARSQQKEAHDETHR